MLSQRGTSILRQSRRTQMLRAARDGHVVYHNILVNHRFHVRCLLLARNRQRPKTPRRFQDYKPGWIRCQIPENERLTFRARRHAGVHLCLENDLAATGPPLRSTKLRMSGCTQYRVRFGNRHYNEPEPQLAPNLKQILWRRPSILATNHLRQRERPGDGRRWNTTAHRTANVP
jgi:hypothetical protein